VNLSRNAVLWIAIVLLLFTLYHLFQSAPPGGRDEPIPYSEFRASVAAGQVSEVTMQGDELTGQFKDRGRFKTVEDVAGLIPDDLRGYTEINKDGEKVHEEGLLESFNLSGEQAQSLIMQARVKAGWIDASALEPEVEEDEEAEDAAPTAEEVFGS